MKGLSLAPITNQAILGVSLAILLQLLLLGCGNPVDENLYSWCNVKAFYTIV